MNRLRVPSRTYVVMDFEGDLADDEDAFDYLHHGWLRQEGLAPVMEPSFEVFSNDK